MQYFMNRIWRIFLFKLWFACYQSVHKYIHANKFTHDGTENIGYFASYEIQFQK